jgi:oligosaccharyltransferase complex subunit delta (ribophorin II)
LSNKPLQASIVIGSFGSSEGLVAQLFDLEAKQDVHSPAPKYEKPLRYGKLPEIHHIFRKDPKNPPKIVSLFFVGAVAAALPALFIAVRPVSPSLRLSDFWPPKQASIGG